MDASTLDSAELNALKDGNYYYPNINPVEMETGKRLILTTDIVYVNTICISGTFFDFKFLLLSFNIFFFYLFNTSIPKSI